MRAFRTQPAHSFATYINYPESTKAGIFTNPPIEPNISENRVKPGSMWQHSCNSLPRLLRFSMSPSSGATTLLVERSMTEWSLSSWQRWCLTFCPSQQGLLRAGTLHASTLVLWLVAESLPIDSINLVCWELWLLGMYCDSGIWVNTKVLPMPLSRETKLCS